MRRALSGPIAKESPKTSEVLSACILISFGFDAELDDEDFDGRTEQSMPPGDRALDSKPASGLVTEGLAGSARRWGSTPLGRSGPAHSRGSGVPRSARRLDHASASRLASEDCEGRTGWASPLPR